MRLSPALLIILLLFIWPPPASAQVVINEYSCSNLNSIPDNFGGFEDWIELYNPSASAVNLTGWYLSDKKTTPTKWQLGNVVITANGFIRIWASGRGINTGGNLHANFKLTQCRPEAIVLANSAGTIIDSLTLVPAQVGHSRGRTTDGASTWSVFLNPTPNASNSNAYQGYATSPLMSVSPGFYSSAQTVSISSPDPNVTIYYTTNGSTPTTSSTVYTTPITISATTVLRARAFSSSPTIAASFITSNTYFINTPHTVEVVSVYGDQLSTLMGGTKITAAAGMEYFDASGTIKAESYGQTNSHGNDSWAYPQRGIDFVSFDQYGYNYAVLHQVFNSKARNEFQRLIIKAAANDNYPFTGNPNSNFNGELGGAHIRDAYVHTLSQKAGLHLDERTWAPGILYVNGNYWGVYDTREKVDDADFTDFYHNTDGDSLQFLKTWGNTWAEYGGNQAINDWQALRTYILGNNMAVQSNYDYVDSLFSVKSFADYFFLNTLCVTSDWLNWNTAWWRGINANANKKKWRYTLWDMDATFKHYINYTGIPNTNPNADPCDPQSLNPNPPDDGHIAILNALLQNPGFKQYYVMRYFDLMNNGLSCNRMITVLDSMILVITPEMPRQITRWGGTMAQWQQNVQDLRNFILARCDSIVNGFAPCNGTTGPYKIKVNVQPPGAGNVDVNSINVTQFVWSATYPGGVNLNLTAHANPTYCFDHWEFQNHTPSPSLGDSAVYVNLTQTDSIIAHFVLVGGTPSVTATFDSICAGDSTVLSAGSGSGFLWSPSTGLSCITCATPVATPTITTSYSVQVSGTCSNGVGTITIQVAQPKPPTVSSSPPIICQGGSSNLLASGNTYSWSPSTGLSCTTCPNPVAAPTVTTTYSVTAAGTCMAGTTPVTITVENPPVPAVSPNTTICNTSQAQLSVSGANTYSWVPAAGLSCSNCATPVATPSVTTTYTVIASGTAPNCMGLDTVTVFVTSDCPDLYIPTGFSPNGDNNNEMLFVMGGELKEMTLTIYNRWGEVVFETTDQLIGWDGKHRNKPVQAGVYAYKFRGTDSKNNLIERSGNITVIR